MTFREDPWGRIVTIGLCVACVLGIVFGLVTDLPEFAGGSFLALIVFGFIAIGHACSKGNW